MALALFLFASRAALLQRAAPGPAAAAVLAPVCLPPPLIAVASPADAPCLARTKKGQAVSGIVSLRARARVLVSV